MQQQQGGAAATHRSQTPEMHLTFIQTDKRTFNFSAMRGSCNCLHGTARYPPFAMSPGLTHR